jgi:hypothetical protein
LRHNKRLIYMRFNMWCHPRRYQSLEERNTLGNEGYVDDGVRMIAA